MTSDERASVGPEAMDETGEDGLEEAVSESSLEDELERTKAAYARAMADYQNLQRRSREERAELTRLTMKSLVLNYLPILDDLNRAIDSVTEHEDIVEHPWVEGVRMVQRKFLGVLEAAGVQPIEADVGVTFDPQIHEAVANHPGAANEIIAVIQGGYAIDGAVIRPAMVIVGNGEAAPAAQD
ncbi:MAG: nucleotide exchange factor GrpE [Dehalococcoidia bacterium]